MSPGADVVGSVKPVADFAVPNENDMIENVFGVSYSRFTKSFSVWFDALEFLNVLTTDTIDVCAQHRREISI